MAGVLITGFEPFGGEAVNPSWEVVKRLDGAIIGGQPVAARQLPCVFGDALTRALGDKKGINRYGMFYCPMDEALTRVVIDLSGRPYLVYDVKLAVERIGTFETEMLTEVL